MLAPIVHTNKYHPSFGERIQFGKPGDTNPSVQLNSNWEKAVEDDLHIEQAVIELEETQDTKTILHNIRRQHYIEGPLNPTIRTSVSVKAIGDTSHFNRIIPREDDRTTQLIQYVNRFQERLFKSTIESYNNLLAGLNSMVNKAKPNTTEFLDGIIKMNDFLARGITVEVNTESNELKDLVNSDESTIFIFNHEARVLNDALMNGFISLLYKEYKEAGKTKTCPMPKLISAKNLDDSPFSNAMRKLEVVEIDQDLNHTSKRAKTNHSRLTHVIKGFIKNNNNIFIFPEGAKGAKEGLDFAERFQPGTGKIIEMALKRKGNVKVVSVGLASDHNTGGVIHIGKPINFTLEGDQVKVSGGNFSNDKSLIEKSQYYNKLSQTSKDNSIPIYKGGIPVKMGDKQLNRFISGILSTDLPICYNQARADFLEIIGDEPEQQITEEDID